jgi:hypothetical protein
VRHTTFTVVSEGWAKRFPATCSISMMNLTIKRSYHCGGLRQSGREQWKPTPHPFPLPIRWGFFGGWLARLVGLGKAVWRRARRAGSNRDWLRRK